LDTEESRNGLRNCGRVDQEGGNDWIVKKVKVKKKNEEEEEEVFNLFAVTRPLLEPYATTTKIKIIVICKKTNVI
jgi:hypothetical protein